MRRTLPTGDVGEEPHIPLGGKKKKWLEKKGQERQHHLSYLREKGTMGEEDDTKINSLFNILNDLAKGQQAMMDLMG
jgi:hypothetical protein